MRLQDANEQYKHGSNPCCCFPSLCELLHPLQSASLRITCSNKSCHGAAEGLTSIDHSGWPVALRQWALAHKLGAACQAQAENLANQHRMPCVRPITLMAGCICTSERHAAAGVPDPPAAATWGHPGVCHRGSGRCSTCASGWSEPSAETPRSRSGLVDSRQQMSQVRADSMTVFVNGLRSIRIIRLGLCQDCRASQQPDNHNAADKPGACGHHECSCDMTQGSEGLC